jgi:hypothetical protein
LSAQNSLAAELVIRSTGASLCITAAGHLISGRRSVNYGADCFIPVALSRRQQSITDQPLASCRKLPQNTHHWTTGVTGRQEAIGGRLFRLMARLLYGWVDTIQMV